MVLAVELSLRPGTEHRSEQQQVVSVGAPDHEAFPLRGELVVGTLVCLGALGWAVDGPHPA